MHWLAILGSLVNISFPSWQRNRRTTRWSCTFFSFRIFQEFCLATLSFTDTIHMVGRSQWSRALSKARVCGRLLAGIAGSNPAVCMDISLLWMLCVVRCRSLNRTDHLSRGVLPSVVCLHECDRESSVMRMIWPTRSCCAMGEKIDTVVLNIYEYGSSSGMVTDLGRMK